MKALPIEFQRRRPWRTLWLGLAGTLCLMLAMRVLWQAGELYGLLQVLRSEYAMQQASASALSEHLAATQLAHMPHPGAMVALKMAEFPLDRILHSLEDLAVDGVRATSIEISVREGTASAILEWQSAPDLERLLAALAESGKPLSWQVTRIGNGDRAASLGQAQTYQPLYPANSAIAPYTGLAGSGTHTIALSWSRP